MLPGMRKLFGALLALGFVATTAPAFACPYEDSEKPAAQQKVATKKVTKKKVIKKAQARRAVVKKAAQPKPAAKVAKN